MNRLSRNHPNPDKPYFTVFFKEDTQLDDVNFYHLLAKDPNNPDSNEVVYLFDKKKSLLGIQLEEDPKVIAPDLKEYSDFKASPSTFELSLPSSLPDFPPLESLIKALEIKNKIKKT